MTIGKVGNYLLATFALAISAIDMAHAQSTVSLYGQLDAGFIYTSKTAGPTGENIGHTFAMTDAGLRASLFGITGTEVLGGGYSTTFKLESGISLANGGTNNSNGNFFGRQAWVALNSPWGTTTLGLQYSPFILSVYGTDPRSASQFGSAFPVYVVNAASTGIFNSNAISYSTPEIFGFQGSAMLGIGGEPGDFQAGRQYSLSALYHHDNLWINAGFYDGNQNVANLFRPNAIQLIESTLAMQGRMVGAAYLWGSVLLKTQFVNYRLKPNQYGFGGSALNRNVYVVGFEYFATPALDISAGVYYIGDRIQSDNRAIMTSLAAEYSLSKRTAVYAQVGTVNNRGTMNVGLDTGTTSLVTGVAGTTVGVDFGIRHNF